MILLVDNYDSFVHNLARYVQRLGHETLVVRNDQITVAQIEQHHPSALIISPGPCTPREAGITLDAIRSFAGAIPILGVCLGHQAIVAAFGGDVVRAPTPMHGRTSEILHDGGGVFEGLRKPLTVGRYHSLIVDPDTLPDCLEVSSRSRDGMIMSVRHRQHVCIGVQFHPESILTDSGYPLLANFLRIAGLTATLPGNLTERPGQRRRRTLPQAPVTF